MKKKKFVLTLVLFLFLFSQTALAAWSLYEDFESIADWTTLDGSGGTATVQAAIAKTGNALKLTTLGTTSNNYISINKDLNFIDANIGFWLRKDDPVYNTWLNIYPNPTAAYINNSANVALVHAAQGVDANICNFDVNAWYWLVVERVDDTHINAYVWNSAGNFVNGLMNSENTGGAGVPSGYWYSSGGTPRLLLRDNSGSANNMYYDDLYVGGAGFVETPITVYSPAADRVFQTSADVNTAFDILGTCAVYDVNVLNLATGQDDNLFFTGVVSDGVRQDNNYFFFAKQGAQTFRVETYCIAEAKQRDFDVNVSFELYDLNITIEDYTTYDGNNYINALDYNISYRCGALGREVDINLFLDDGNVLQHSLTCDNSVNFIETVYNFPENGAHNLKIKLDAVQDIDNNVLFDVNFIVDLNAPQIIAHDVNNSLGFFTSDNSTAWLVCNDNESPILFYEILQNDVNIMDLNTMPGDLNTVDVDLNNGVNNFVFNCRDLAGNYDSDLNELNVYAKYFALIDEDDRNAFNLDNCKSLVAYSYDSNFFYDFKTEDKTAIYYFSQLDDAIRFEIIYDNVGTDVLITREFDMSVLDDQNINVCAPQLQSFFQQIFISTSERQIIAINNFANCYLVAAKTKYAFSNVFSLDTYTIAKPYYLYTFQENQKALLALIDGGKATEINIDMMEFAGSTIGFNVAADEVSIVPHDVNIVRIYYQNIGAKNSSVSFEIFDGSTSIWSYIETTNPDEITIYFNFSTIDINAELLELRVNVMPIDGEAETIRRYFTLTGSAGILNPGIAITIAFIVLILGLTMVAKRIALGWFGLVIGGIALAVLSFAPSVWYVTFAQAITVMVTIFIALGFKAETAKVI